MTEEAPEQSGAQLLRLRELATRWLVAHLLLNNAIGRRMPLEELGAEIAREEHRATPYDQSTIHRIETAKQEPSADQVLAFCAVLARHGVTIDPGWLHYGDATKAPAPKTPLLAAKDLLRP